LPEFNGDITEEIRAALDAQGYTASFMGTNETYEQLVRIILRDISVTGGSPEAKWNQFDEAVNWARVNNIMPRPDPLGTPTRAPSKTIITTGLGGGPVATTITQDQLDNAIDAEAFISMVPDNMNAAAAAAMGALTWAASQQGLRYLRMTPLLMGRFGIALGALELIDLVTPGVDIPTVSDVPRWLIELLSGSGSTVTDEEGDVLSTIERLINWIVPGTPFSANGANPFTVGQVFMQNQIVKTWEANGVWFARQADGLNWVQRKNGTIKSFRNVKPIVLTSSRASTPKIAERALKALYNQYKGMRKAFKPFDKPAPRRASPRRDYVGDNVTQIKN